MTTQIAITRELQREVEMRRKVWRETPGIPGHFSTQAHINQFRAVADALLIFENMPPEMFRVLVNRVERQAAEAKAQHNLFEP